MPLLFSHCADVEVEEDVESCTGVDGHHLLEPSGYRPLEHLLLHDCQPAGGRSAGCTPLYRVACSELTGVVQLHSSSCN